MSNNDRVQCTDPKCTNKYGANSSMRQHYIAKHTEESLKRGSRAAHPTERPLQPVHQWNRELEVAPEESSATSMSRYSPTASDCILSTECRIPVVYNGNLVQGIEPTAKWYEFIYKAGATPMVKDKRERGFREADAILLKLFEGFNIEEEMRVHFADRDERRWNKFNRNRVTKKECVAWNNDGKYRLGACIYIPQRLNFAKELLDDFKTSRLFQGTDLENFRKGIQVLRDLMIETAEKIRHRPPKLLGEHVAPIAGFEDGDNSEVHVAEGIPENSCDQYPEPDDMTSIDCINQDTVTTIDNMIESGKDDYEFSTSDSWDYETFSYNRL
ncbi:hypothetical protein BGZ58_007082 [Dissophora ornata]|nr:hypothetical protein BGZ58_007082 [Dissophora ornata]